jgi:hypothetical protein
MVGEEEYSLQLSAGGEILWTTESDSRIIYSNLEAFLSAPAISTEDNFLDKIEYLDLRTKNKVFYKFRN